MSGIEDLFGVPDLSAPPPAPAPVAQPAPAPASPAPPAPPAPPTKGTPFNVTIGTQISRAQVASPAAPTGAIDLTQPSFEAKLGALLAKDLEIANHDRAMATALLRVHLDRAEELDKLALSMPVATVIADNTGATLKSLELAMRAGERVHKIAELLVAAQKNDDVNAIAALKAKTAVTKGDSWTDEDIPDNRPA